MKYRLTKHAERTIGQFGRNGIRFVDLLRKGENPFQDARYPHYRVFCDELLRARGGNLRYSHLVGRIMVELDWTYELACRKAGEMLDLADYYGFVEWAGNEKIKVNL